MTKEKHIHKLKRLRYKSGNEIFFCALPDCSFKTNTALALGKRSICWRCGQDFIMNEYSLRLAKPHCDECHRPNKTTEDNPEFVSESNTPAPAILSLTERLQQTIQSKQQTEEDEL